MGKDVVIDWLKDVPEDAEISIDVGQFGQRDLVAFLEGGETDMWILALDAFTPPAHKSLLDQRHEAMLNRLQQIHAEGGETEHGVTIVTLKGVLSGEPKSILNEFRGCFHLQRQDTSRKFCRGLFRRAGTRSDSRLLDESLGCAKGQKRTRSRLGR